MTARRAALALRAALTFSCAVLVHGAAHAAGDRGFAWDSPVHTALLVVALALLGGAAGGLGLCRPSSERRRRLALIRAALPAGPGAIIGDVAAQAGIASAIFLAEGPVLAPGRLALAVACGLLALLFTGLVFRRGARRVVALLAALDAPRERRAAAFSHRATGPLAFVVAADYRLFVPNRPPPVAA